MTSRYVVRFLVLFVGFFFCPMLLRRFRDRLHDTLKAAAPSRPDGILSLVSSLLGIRCSKPIKRRRRTFTAN